MLYMLFIYGEDDTCTTYHSENRSFIMSTKWAYELMGYDVMLQTSPINRQHS